LNYESHNRELCLPLCRSPHSRITQDLKISGDCAFIKSLGGGKPAAIKRVLEYQACDDKICYSRRVCRQAGKCGCYPWTASAYWLNWDKICDWRCPENPDSGKSRVILFAGRYPLILLEPPAVQNTPIASSFIKQKYKA
jgi:hypothetical protein